jgi:DNA-binding transcriptional LysR family regulator
MTKGIRNPQELLHNKLIHLEEPTRERPGWEQWFRHFGVTEAPPVSGLRLNDYALVWQAALAGEGIACGWHHVAAPLVQRGLLYAYEDWSWDTGAGFYLVWSKRVPLIDNAERIRDWVIAQAE